MELKGSRREKNILAAFAGESQARNRYTYFASRGSFDPEVDEYLHHGDECTE